MKFTKTLTAAAIIAAGLAFSAQAAEKVKIAMVVKTLGKSNKAPDLQLVRMAPPDMTQDKLWGWFNDIRDKGILLSDRSNNRKSGSIASHAFSTSVGVAKMSGLWLVAFRNAAV